MGGEIEGLEKCCYSVDHETQGRNDCKERAEWHLMERGRANISSILNGN